MGLKEKVDSSPDNTGVYLLKDRDGKVIYVGKAASIRKRLKGRLQKFASAREKSLIGNIADLDYILTPDESTALLLEAALIKRYKPRYNVSLRDDKSYPRLKLTVNEEYPRLFIARKIKADGALYFGPYTNAKLLRKALMFMKRTFPLRACRVIPKKPCLEMHLGQCLAPCVDKSRREEYLAVVKELSLFLDGHREELIDSLSQQMKLASDNKEYEKAAKIRDRIEALSFIRKRKGDRLLFSIKGVSQKSSLSPFSQLEELRSILSLPDRPYDIEAFDVSNISGKEAVGSMVSFKDGKPDKDRYRKFKIKTVNVIDDYSMMHEIVTRRYRRLSAEGGSLPNLIVIDGGKGHLTAAKRALNSLGLWKIPVISIAKGLDKIYVSKDREPIILGKFGGALLLMQRIRDEAHRFAIGYHRLLRRRQARASELDNIEGIGPKRKSLLIRHFGSLDEIRMADVEDLRKVRFISEKEARAIYNYFH